MNDEKPGDGIILKAEFDRDAIIKYSWVGLIPLCVFIVTIPLVLLIAIGYWFFLDRMVANWSAELTHRSLIVRKGIFNKIEKTIPLEKITDLSSVQGPIMRMFDLKRLGVETAGQSGAAGASLVSLMGIVNTDDFRKRVLAQRDLLAAGGSTAAPSPTTGAIQAIGEEGELADIAATLRRIETTLNQIQSDRATD